MTLAYSTTIYTIFIFHLRQVGVQTLGAKGQTVCREMEVSKIDEETHRRGRRVYQLQYTRWPEHGLPHNGDDVIHLLKEARAKNSTAPLLVHCR